MLLEILLCLLALLLLLYWYITQPFDFFRARGIFHLKPSFPVGSPEVWDVLKRKKEEGKCVCTPLLKCGKKYYSKMPDLVPL